MIVIQKRADVTPGTDLYYARLAEFMVQSVDFGNNSVILEAGCGSGALTVPLTSLVKYSKYICYDYYSGVYEQYLQEILTKNTDISLIKGDVRTMSFYTESVDIIVSNELLCELTRDDTRKAIQEFYMILKKGGQFIHGDLSPYPENKAQELVIIADTYSAEPIFEKEWFSPPADELVGMLHQAGFSTITVRYFEESLRFEGDIAFEQVKNWVTKPEFFEKYSKDLREHGLEYPMEQVVIARKNEKTSNCNECGKP